MKLRLLFFSLLFLTLIGTSSATVYSLDLDNQANINGQEVYSTVSSIPEYEGLSAVSKSSLEGQCSGELRTVTWNGESGETEVDTIYSTRGYAFVADEECDVSINSEDYTQDNPPQLFEGWNIISTGSSTIFDQAQSELAYCQVNDSKEYTDRKKLYEIEREGSPEIRKMTDTLRDSRAYWVEVEESCKINQETQNDGLLSPPEDEKTEENPDYNDGERDDIDESEDKKISLETYKVEKTNNVGSSFVDLNLDIKNVGSEDITGKLVLTPSTDSKDNTRRLATAEERTIEVEETENYEIRIDNEWPPYRLWFQKENGDYAQTTDGDATIEINDQQDQGETDDTKDNQEESEYQGDDTGDSDGNEIIGVSEYKITENDPYVGGYYANLDLVIENKADQDLSGKVIITPASDSGDNTKRLVTSRFREIENGDNKEYVLRIDGERPPYRLWFQKENGDYAQTTDGDATIEIEKK